MIQEDVKLINLTPHPIHFYNKDGTINIYPVTGLIARTVSAPTLLKVINGQEIWRRRTVDIRDLPKEEEGTLYIVSSIIQRSCIDIGQVRTDLLTPNELIKEQDRVIGCKSWQVMY